MLEIPLDFSKTMNNQLSKARSRIGSQVNQIFSKIQRRVIRQIWHPGLLSTVKVRAGKRVFLAPVSNRKWADISEPFMLDLFERSFPLKTGAFLDIGVNLGQTLMAVKSADPLRPYVGLEPNPACVAYCEKFISLNELRDCKLIPAGLGETDELLNLELYSDNEFDSSASLIPNFRPDESSCRTKIVPVYSYDTLSTVITDDHFGIIKIDVEGAELSVLKALIDVLRRTNAWVFVEILPPYSSQNTRRVVNQQEIWNIFKDLDYDVFLINKTASGRFSALKKMKAFEIHGDISKCDFLCAPSSDRDAIDKIRIANMTGA